MSITLPKGTRDFYPEYQQGQNYIFETWKKACQLHGYQAYEGPVFEHIELYTGKSGDEIVEQLYNFETKGKDHLALRPEMTPTLARMINQKGPALKKPCKWFSIPRLFRYERKQKGRLREFFQLNMDIMGSESLLAEGDLLLAIIRMLRLFGLQDSDFRVGISSRSLLSAILKQRNVEQEIAVYSALDKKAKETPERFAQLLGEAGLNEADQKFFALFMECQSIEALRPFCESEEAQKSLLELQELFELLADLGAANCLALDLNVVRGLAYYTGIVFEVFDEGKNHRAIAGGGRYDNLTSVLGGQKVSGVGFGMGDVVLRDLLEEKGLMPQQYADTPDIFLATFGGDLKSLFTLAEKLRNHGLKVIHPLQATKFKKQMELANTQGCSYVLFADAEKSIDGKYEIKDLSNGEQFISSINEFLEKIA